MLELEMENARVERLRLRQMAEGWIHAIMEGAFDRLESYCHPEINSHLLTPGRYAALQGPTDLTAKFCQWFGACCHFQLIHSRVEGVGERLGVFYRFLLEEDGSWFVVEQQMYWTLQDGRITHLHLLCSGFRPAGVPAQQETPASLEIPQDNLLEIYSRSEANGSTCALLTPAIKAKLREMQSGQLLEVRVDDPTARGDIEAWCRLSGNKLVKMNETEDGELRFFVQKK